VLKEGIYEGRTPRCASGIVPLQDNGLQQRGGVRKKTARLRSRNPAISIAGNDLLASKVRLLKDSVRAALKSFSLPIRLIVSG
jgi:hypothetical protein